MPVGHLGQQEDHRLANWGGHLRSQQDRRLPAGGVTAKINPAAKTHLTLRFLPEIIRTILGNGVPDCQSSTALAV